MYKVLIADDETLDLEGMRTFIPWSELGMEVVGAVTNGYAACELIERQRIDVLVTDVQMPNMTGLELARRAKQRVADMRVVFVSGYRDFHYVKEALSLQAYSYVLKPMDDQELIEALERVRRDLDDGRRREQAEEELRRRLTSAEPASAGAAADGETIAAESSGAGAIDAGSVGEIGGKNAKLIGEIVAYVSERLDQPITLKEVADEFAFSPNYLGQMFKEATGRTFHEYVAGMRMKKAGELLHDPKLRIYEIAHRVGYRYMPYFSRQFKETYGMTPVEFRNTRAGRQP